MVTLLHARGKLGCVAAEQGEYCTFPKSAVESQTRTLSLGARSRECLGPDARDEDAASKQVFSLHPSKSLADDWVHMHPIAGCPKCTMRDGNPQLTHTRTLFVGDLPRPTVETLKLPPDALPGTSNHERYLDRDCT